jgi:hypothetical protein
MRGTRDRKISESLLHGINHDSDHVSVRSSTNMPKLFEPSWKFRPAESKISKRRIGEEGSVGDPLRQLTINADCGPQ